MGKRSDHRIKKYPLTSRSGPKKKPKLKKKNETLAAFRQTNHKKIKKNNSSIHLPPSHRSEGEKPREKPKEAKGERNETLSMFRQIDHIKIKIIKILPFTHPMTPSVTGPKRNIKKKERNVSGILLNIKS